MIFGMLSGPVDFLTLIEDKSFSTPFEFICRGDMLVLHLADIVGRSLFVILVKTDLNWSTKMSDLPTPSFTSVPFFFNGGVPIFCPGVWILYIFKKVWCCCCLNRPV